MDEGEYRYDFKKHFANQFQNSYLQDTHHNNYERNSHQMKDEVLKPQKISMSQHKEPRQPSKNQTSGGDADRVLHEGSFRSRGDYYRQQNIGDYDNDPKQLKYKDKTSVTAIQTKDITIPSQYQKSYHEMVLTNTAPASTMHSNDTPPSGKYYEFGDNYRYNYKIDLNPKAAPTIHTNSITHKSQFQEKPTAILDDLHENYSKTKVPDAAVHRNVNHPFKFQTNNKHRYHCDSNMGGVNGNISEEHRYHRDSNIVRVNGDVFEDSSQKSSKTVISRKSYHKQQKIVKSQSKNHEFGETLKNFGGADKNQIIQKTDWNPKSTASAVHTDIIPHLGKFQKKTMPMVEEFGDYHRYNFETDSIAGGFGGGNVSEVSAKSHKTSKTVASRSQDLRKTITSQCKLHDEIDKTLKTIAKAELELEKNIFENPSCRLNEYETSNQCLPTLSHCKHCSGRTHTMQSQKNAMTEIGKSDFLECHNTNTLTIDVDDLVNSKVINPMMRKLQRMCLNNLKGEMSLMEDLDRLPYKVNAVYKATILKQTD